MVKDFFIRSRKPLLPIFFSRFQEILKTNDGARVSTTYRLVLTMTAWCDAHRFRGVVWRMFFRHEIRLAGDLVLLSVADCDYRCPTADTVVGSGLGSM